MRDEDRHFVERVVVAAAAVVYGGIGLYVLAAPDRALAAVSLPLPNDTARADVMATYGGMCLGIGIWLGLCARHSESVRVGLWGVCLGFGGLALGRIVALVEGLVFTPILYGFLGLELVVATIAGGLLAS